MTQEDKELLLKDLCARFPYSIYFSANGGDRWLEVSYIEGDCVHTVEYPQPIFDIKQIKPYLRPMSSMTEEEKKELSYESSGLIFDAAMNASQGYNVKTVAGNAYIIDYLIAHHIDYRGLIEKGLALEAPEGMYKTE